MKRQLLVKGLCPAGTWLGSTCFFSRRLFLKQFELLRLCRYASEQERRVSVDPAKAAKRCGTLLGTLDLGLL